MLLITGSATSLTSWHIDWTIPVSEQIEGNYHETHNGFLETSYTLQKNNKHECVKSLAESSTSVHLLMVAQAEKQTPDELFKVDSSKVRSGLRERSCVNMFRLIGGLV